MVIVRVVFSCARATRSVAQPAIAVRHMTRLEVEGDRELALRRMENGEIA